MSPGFPAVGAVLRAEPFEVRYTSGVQLASRAAGPHAEGATRGSSSVLTRPASRGSPTGPEDAPAVLLVMGLAYPAALWFRLVPALAEGYRVIRVDNRGAGRTGDVAGAPYTVETMAADCLAVLDAADVDTAHFVGISLGGLITQEIVLTAPERVRSLCLIATHPGIAHAVMNPEAMAMLMQRGQMTPQEAAAASIPFNYAPETPRERIEEDWAVGLPLAATNEGYLAQVVGSSRWDGYLLADGSYGTSTTAVANRG